MAEYLTDGIVTILSKYGDEPDNEFWRQMGVRVKFSLIDSLCYGMKQFVILSHHYSMSDFVSGELMCLDEISYYVSEKGKIQQRKSFHSTDSSLRFAFRMTAKLIGSEFNLTKDSKGMQIFNKAIEIRHRITHPKEPSDLIVTSQEYQLIGDVYTWFADNYRNLAKQVDSYFKSKRVS